MNQMQIGQKIPFVIDGKNGDGTPLDLTNATVTSSDESVATVTGTVSDDGTSLSGFVVAVSAGAVQITADDVLADGEDVRAAGAISVVSVPTLEIVFGAAEKA